MDANSSIEIDITDDYSHYMLWFFYSAYLREPLHLVDGITGQCYERSMTFEVWLDHVDMYGLSYHDFIQRNY